MGIFNMEENKKTHQPFHDPWFKANEKSTPSPSSSTVTSSVGEESNGCSSDVTDDASSSAYDLSEIMTQLPIKRGLSKFYHGKSESFTSLSRATSIEDLAKKGNHCRRNLRACESIGTGLHSYKAYTLPKPVIAKKSTKGSSFSCRRH